MTRNARELPCVIAVALLLGAGCTDHENGRPLGQIKEPLESQARKTDLALLAIEKDQVDPYTEAGDFGDSNLLLGRNSSYAHCSGYRRGAFAQYVLDGDVRRGWRLPDSDTRGWDFRLWLIESSCAKQARAFAPIHC